MLRFFIPLIALSLIVTSCDVFTHVQPDTDIEEVLPELEMKRISFPNRDGSADTASYPFIMNYSTLAHTDIERPYQYFRYSLEFPKEVLREANGKTRRVRYRYAFPAPNARPDARNNDDGYVVFRVVNAIIPDSDTAQKMIEQRTSFFHPPGNIQQAFVEYGAEKDLPLYIHHFSYF